MSRRGVIIASFLLLLSSVIWAGRCEASDVCYQCHPRDSFQKNSVHKPVKTGKCTQCHNPHAAKHQSLLSKEVTDLCYSCHRQEAASFQVGRIHQPTRDGLCTTCHEPHSAANKKLLRGSFAEICFECHKNVSEKYPFVHQPFQKGECASCHAAHTAEHDNLLRKSPEKICVSCHTRQEIASGHKDYPQTITGCLSCHNPHGSKNRFLVRNNLHEPFTSGCDDCHQGGVVDSDICLECHGEILDEVAKIQSHFTDSGGNSCSNCHTPHAGDSPNLLRGRQKHICRKCHEDTFTRYENMDHQHLETVEDCTLCHSPHGSNRIAMLKDDGNAICEQCHETQGVFTHPVGEEVKDMRNGQMMTCISCHNPHGSNYEYNLKKSGDKDLCSQCHKGY